jgi:hypothetical protein
MIEGWESTSLFVPNSDSKGLRMRHWSHLYKKWSEELCFYSHQKVVSTAKIL